MPPIRMLKNKTHTFTTAVKSTLNKRERPASYVYMGISNTKKKLNDVKFLPQHFLLFLNVY